MQWHAGEIYFGVSNPDAQPSPVSDSHLTTSLSIEKECGLDAISVFSSLRSSFDGECFLLESVEGARKSARYSFVGVGQVSQFKSVGNKIEIGDQTATVPDPYGALRSYFRSLRSGASEVAPFSGGMVGYLGYGMVNQFDGIAMPPTDGEALPDMHFMVPEHLVCLDHLNSRTFLVSHGKMADLKDALSKARPVPPSDLKISSGRSLVSQSQFEKMVSTAKDEILDGEIFQVVISRSTDFTVDGDPLEMYRTLRALNPSPYMFYLDFGKVKLLGSSPEMLVRLEGNRLTTRPLAGTRPRSSDIEDDEKLKNELLLDEKERAEHLMLVDLHRNDMGRVSKYGTVKVTELMEIEKYSHVQHIVSNVESEIRQDADGFSALRSCFPAGTVTGAPKIRAMEIISDLEGSHRGLYAGTVGYFDFTGNMDFAITIRSIVVNGNRARLQAGAGIVADSVPEREFAETEHKMGATLEAIESGNPRRSDHAHLTR